MFSTVSFCTYVEFLKEEIFIGMQEKNNDAHWKKINNTDKKQFVKWSNWN